MVYVSPMERRRQRLSGKSSESEAAGSYVSPGARRQARRKAERDFEKKRKKQIENDKDSGGFLGLGLGNLWRMPGQMVAGAYNLGKGIITTPGQTLPMAGASIYQSVLGTLDTLTGGVVPYERLPGAGDDIQPLWNREGGMLPALVEDVGNAAIVAGGSGLAISSASKLNAIRAAGLAAKGKPIAAAAQKAAGLRKAKLITKTKLVSRPYQSLYHKVARPYTKAAFEAKLAAAGVAAKGAAKAEDIAATSAKIDDAGIFPQKKFGPPEPTDATRATVEAAVNAGAKPRGWLGRTIYGSSDKGEAGMSLTQRLLAGAEERITGYELRPFIRQQERLAEAVARRTLRSPEVKASVSTAVDHVLPIVDDTDLATRIVGDEIKSRLTGIRGWQKSLGISDEVAVELGIRQEVMPKALHNNPEFAAAIDTATDLWRNQRIEAFKNMQDTRLGKKGLPDAAGDESVILTKNEMRKLRSAEGNLKRANEMEGAHQRERMRTEKKGAGIEDELARNAERSARVRRGREANVNDFDEARAGTPDVWKNNPKAKANWATRTAEMVEKLGPDQEFRGFTYSPARDAFVETVQAEGRYVVGIVPGIEPIPFESITAELLDQIARQYQEVFPGNHDVVLGGWVDDANMAYIEPSQIVQTRSDAMVLGNARGQRSAWDLLDGVEINTEIGRPDISGQFAGRRVQRNRVAGKYYDIVANKKQGVRFTNEDVDLAMAVSDAQAVQWGKLRDVPADNYYANIEVQYRVKAPKAGANVVGELTQTLLGIEPNMALYKEMVDAGYDVDKMMKWYYRSHDAIEKRWRGQAITLLNGHEVDAADLMYDLIAVTSVASSPATNLGNALTGIANILEFQKNTAGRIRGFENLITDYMKAGGKSKLSTELFDQLAGETHRFGTTKQNVMDIFEGNTIEAYTGWDGWTVEYIRGKSEKFGGKHKPLTDKPITPEDVDYFKDKFRPTFEGTEAELTKLAHNQAVAEYHGSAALNKLKSFRENLAHPDTSTAVTIDSIMLRGFSPNMGLSHDLAGSWVGVHRQLGDKVRGLADQLSDHLGRTVQPHEVQALVWGYFKHEISKQNVGVVMAHGADALEEMRAGRWTPETDPMVEYFDLDANMAKERLYDLEVRNGKERLPKTEEVKVIREAREVQEAETMGTITHETRITIADSDKKILVKQIERADRYLDEQREIAELYANPATRKDAIDLMTKKVNETVGDVRDTSWGDFADQMDSPSAKVSAQEERLAIVDKAPIEELAQQIGDRVLGTTVLGHKGGRLIIRLFENADFTTLVHENAHVFRQIVDPKDLAKLEKAYGVSKGGKWSRVAEEAFADDFVSYLASGRKPKDQWLTPIFERTRAVLKDFWAESKRFFAGDRNGINIPQGTRQLLDEYLDPDIFPTEALPGLELKGLTPTDPRHLVSEARKLPPEVLGETAAQQYRKGVTTGRTAEAFRESFKKERALTAQRRKLLVQRDAMKKALLDDTGPVANRQRMLRQRADANLESVSGSADNPSVARVPAQWQPLWQAVKDLTEEATKNPQLAAAISDMPDTFSAVIERAQALGLDPVHVRNFTQKQVQTLVFKSMKLGRPGARLGEEVTAGTRKARVFSDKSGYASIESLVAAVNEVTWEKRTNFLVDHIEKNIARVAESGEVPDGWTSWSATKSRMIDVDPDTGVRRVQPGDLIVPKTVDDVLRRYNKDFTHPWSTAIGKITKPWRTFVLLLSPRWYANNLLGNMMLATAEGVRMGDWIKAWRSYRNKAGAFDDIPEAVGHSFVAQELGDAGGGLVTYGSGVKGIRHVQKAEGLKEASKVVKHRLARANAVVDDMARAAVYHKTIRTTGSAERAVQRSYEALVDYGNLSSFEQNMVRAVVPFYSWQKGMLKAVGRIYVEHPAAIGVMYMIDDLNKKIMEDRWGTELPAAYEGIIEVPFLGAINTRGLNPFQDAAQLTTPEGIAQSINPFIKIGLQAGFHSPAYGQGERKVGDFGVVEDFVDYEKALKGIITGLPQAQAIRPQGKGVGLVSSFEKYLGIPVIPPKQLKGILDRTKRARASVAGVSSAKPKTPPTPISGSSSGYVSPMERRRRSRAG